MARSSARIPSPSEYQMKNARECWEKAKRNLETGGWLDLRSESRLFRELVEDYFEGREIVRLANIVKDSKSTKTLSKPGGVEEFASSTVRSGSRGLERKGLIRPEQVEGGGIAFRLTPFALDFICLMSRAPETLRLDYCIAVIVKKTAQDRSGPRVCLVKPKEESRDKDFLFNDWTFPALDAREPKQRVSISKRAAQEQAGCTFDFHRMFDNEVSSISVGTGYVDNNFVHRTVVILLGKGSEIMGDVKSRNMDVRWFKKDEFPDRESTATLAERNFELSDLAKEINNLSGFWDEVGEVANES
jgi:hypothetical protein